MTLREVTLIALQAWLAAGCDHPGDRQSSQAPTTRPPPSVASQQTPSPDTTLSAGAVTPSPADAASEQRSLSIEGAPSVRADHTAVWTGREMIVWGGDDALALEEDGYAPVPPHPLATGGAYDPVADRWRPIATRGAPSARSGHGAIWTGREMIVWGGSDGRHALGDGAAYDPSLDRWRAIARTAAPRARSLHTLVWTGTEAIVWGGRDERRPLGDGAAYDPATDRWRQLSRADAPAPRRMHVGVWTGHEMIVWGGLGTRGELADGGRYRPADDRWVPMASVGAPSARHDAGAVFAQEALIVMGGATGGGAVRPRPASGGARYLPASDRWSPLEGPDDALRDGVLLGWTGTSLVVSGEPGSDDPRSGSYLARLRVGANAWESFSGMAAFGGTMIAASDFAIVWGGFDGNNLVNEGVSVGRPAR